jgi:hypothetical protein
MGENLKVVFNFNFGLFVMHAIAQHIHACPNLELKTRPRFYPFSLGLPMAAFEIFLFF